MAESNNVKNPYLSCFQSCTELGVPKINSRLCQFILFGCGMDNALWHVATYIVCKRCEDIWYACL